jgi:hypothetical protein
MLVALCHRLRRLLRAKVCQRCGRCWGCVALPALLWVQKEPLRGAGADEKRVARRAKTRERLIHRSPQKQASLAQTAIPPNKPPTRPTR